MAGYAILALRSAIGWILLSAAIQKFTTRHEFAGTLRRFGFPLASLASLFIPTVELISASALLMGLGWRLAAATAAFLCTGFALFTFWALIRGYQAECGCGGLLPTRHFDIPHLASVLLLLAGSLFIFSSSSSALAVDWSPLLRHDSSGTVAAGALIAVATPATILALLSLAEVIRLLHPSTAAAPI